MQIRPAVRPTLTPPANTTLESPNTPHVLTQLSDINWSHFLQRRRQARARRRFLETTLAVLEP